MIKKNDIHVECVGAILSVSPVRTQIRLFPEFLKNYLFDRHEFGQNNSHSTMHSIDLLKFYLEYLKQFFHSSGEFSRLLSGYTKNISSQNHQISQKPTKFPNLIFNVIGISDGFQEIPHSKSTRPASAQKLILKISYDYRKKILFFLLLNTYN